MAQSEPDEHPASNARDDAGLGDDDEGTDGQNGGQEAAPSSAQPSRRHEALGVGSLKQYMAAAGMLQEIQHSFLFGDWITPKLTTANPVKIKFRTLKSNENKRRLALREDMAKGDLYMSAIVNIVIVFCECVDMT